MPNSIELDQQQLSSSTNLDSHEFNPNKTSNNNIEIIGTHLILPEDSLNQIVKIFNNN